MVTVRKQLVKGRARIRSKGTNARAYVTVHQTGNTGRGADAAAHANLQSRGNSRSASWHYTVDDHEAVQSYPHTARCWHAGDGSGPGNYSSIGVEHAVNSDGDYAQTLRNGAQLVAKICEAEGIPTANVVQHNKWSGKDCPAQLRDGKGGTSWADYLRMVDKFRNGGIDTTPGYHWRTVTKRTHVYRDGPGKGRGRLLPVGYRFTVVDGSGVRRGLTWWVKTTSGNYVRSHKTRKD